MTELKGSDALLTERGVTDTEGEASPESLQDAVTIMAELIKSGNLSQPQLEALQMIVVHAKDAIQTGEEQTKQEQNKAFFGTGASQTEAKSQVEDQVLIDRMIGDKTLLEQLVRSGGVTLNTQIAQALVANYDQAF